MCSTAPSVHGHLVALSLDFLCLSDDAVSFTPASSSNSLLQQSASVIVLVRVADTFALTQPFTLFNTVRDFENSGARQMVMRALDGIHDILHLT
jgi:hypothetical protein